MPIEPKKQQDGKSKADGHDKDLKGAQIREAFLEEYSSDQAIRKYSRGTAGAGIAYLLDHDYGDIYRDVVDRHIPDGAKMSGLNLLEFGCGAGMNLIHLVSMLTEQGIPIGQAYGTDFSEALIAAANREADTELPSHLRKKVRFCVARNESLVDDMVSQLGIAKDRLLDAFHMVIGVNTIRYNIRLGNARDCAQELYALLARGGACIAIDMNRGFPLFRTRLRDRLKKSPEEYYLPSLDEYAAPFVEVGFEVIQKSYFSWIPHSASPRMLRMIRRLTPLLNAVAPTRAMRCLVVSRKPS